MSLDQYVKSAERKVKFFQSLIKTNNIPIATRNRGIFTKSQKNSIKIF